MMYHKKIMDLVGNNLYLERWSIRIPFIHWTIKLHKIVRADDDRCHHDHPWWFWRLILWGGYEETCGPDHKRVIRKPLRISFCPSNFQHRITKLTKDVSWTLVLTGRNTGKWGFFTTEGWKHWQEFLNGNRIFWCQDE